MPQLDISTFLPQLFWLIISFGLLYYILSKFCLPKLDKIFCERDDKISHALSKAERNKKEASKLKAEYEEMVSQAIKTKDSMILEALKEISVMTDHKITQHELELKIMLSNSEQKLKDFKDNSVENVRQIAAEASEEILSSLLNIKTTKQSILQLIKSKGNYGA